MTDRVSGRLVWEHSHREMLPALLFLSELRRRNFPGILEHVSTLGNRSTAEQVTFLPFYYDDQIRDRYLSRGGFEHAWIVNLAYEQMSARCARAYLLPDGRFARESVLHCAWGPRFRSMLLEHGIAEERIFLTGHPRFDIYHHPELLLGRAALARRYGLDADKQWVLIPYNFNMAFISDRLREQLIARGYAITPEFVASFATAREAFTSMMRRLTDEFPDIEFILRVHPAGYEAASLYAGETRKRKNLFVIAEYDIANWITEAALTIVWNSTSSMEAVAAGCPVISYEPEPFAERFELDVSRIVPTFRDVSSIIEVIRSLPNARLQPNLALFEEWYQHRDGRNVERLCDIVSLAQKDYDRFEFREPIGTTARVRVGRKIERSLKAYPGLPKLTRRLFRLEAPPAHAEPDERDLELAVRERSSAPLLEFLK